MSKTRGNNSTAHTSRPEISGDGVITVKQQNKLLSSTEREAADQLRRWREVMRIAQEVSDSIIASVFRELGLHDAPS
jgi:hypothetical protein